MHGQAHESTAEPAEGLSFWPGLIDLVTSALMVFLLLNFLQMVLNVDQIEALVTRAQQARFLGQFEEEFRKEVADGVIGVDRHLNYLQITFSDRVLFDSGEHLLKPAGRSILGRCARLLAQTASSGYRQIQVEGHSDSLPMRRSDYPSDNWDLSTARAISVVRFLTGSGLLPLEAFSANGYADQRPVASNDTAAGRERNRRIEIRLFFALPRESKAPEPSRAS